MFTKTFFAAATLLAGLASAQVEIPLDGVALDLSNSATCPVGSDPTVSALAVVTLDATLNADITLLEGTALESTVTTDVDFEINVCLCIDATVPIADLVLPQGLEAQAIVDATDLIEGLNLGIQVPGVGSLVDLLNNPLADISLDTTGNSVDPCTCPEGATPTCVGAQCSCECPAGFFYNPSSGLCVLTPSGVTRRRVVRAFDSRQAKRSEIEARLAGQ